MRVLLDANLSGRRIGVALRESGHDVLALSEELRLSGLTDVEVLALAAREERILVTRNSRDFAPILREWSEAHRSHAGCILIWGLDHGEFARILAGLMRLFAQRPVQDGWKDLALVLPRLD